MGTHFALFIVVQMICIVLVLGILPLGNNLVLIIAWLERMENASCHVQFNVERKNKFALDLLMRMVAKLWLTFAIIVTHSVLFIVDQKNCIVQHLGLMVNKLQLIIVIPKILSVRFIVVQKICFVLALGIMPLENN